MTCTNTCTSIITCSPMDDETLLAVQFIKCMVPTEMKSAISTILETESFKDVLNRTQIFMKNCSWHPTGEYEHDVTLAANGMLLGFTLGIGIKTNPQLKQDIIDFLEFAKKARGENVIEFRPKRNGNAEGPDHSGGTRPSG